MSNPLILKIFQTLQYVLEKRQHNHYPEINAGRFMALYQAQTPREQESLADTMLTYLAELAIPQTNDEELTIPEALDAMAQEEKLSLQERLKLL